MRWVLVLLLAGCASSKQVYTPDGKVGHAINCSGGARSWGECLSAASDLCGARGYTVIERNGEPVAASVATTQGAFSSQNMSRTMLIACK